MLENVGNTTSRLPIDRFGRNLGGRIPSRPRHVRHYAVQRRIEHSAVMGVWRSNA